MSNHAKMEPAVHRIEIDGPFATGTTAQTVAGGFTQELQITDVVEGRRFTIIGFTLDRTGSLSFTWEFEDEGRGTRVTQRIRASGPEVEEQMEVLQKMEERAPKGMARLAAVLDRLAHVSTEERHAKLKARGWLNRPGFAGDSRL